MIKHIVDEPTSLFESVRSETTENMTPLFPAHCMEPREKAYFSWPWLCKPDGEAAWTKVRVPSFWNTPEQFDFPENWKDVHTAWYSYSWRMDESSDGKHDWFLCFEGVSLLCDVYVNGKPAGSHGGRFTPFELNVTEMLRWGETNTVLVCVGDMTHALDESNNALLYQVGLMKLGEHVPDPFMADHPNFGGIWRPVHLEKRAKTRAENVRIQTSVRNKTISVDFLLQSAAEEVTIRAHVCTWGGDAAELRFPETRIALEKDCETTAAGIASLWSDPKLWSPESPHLYELRLEIFADGVLHDVRRIRFGFREFWIDGRHFYLNGSKVRLLGESINMCQQLLCSNHRKDYALLLFRTLREEMNMNCLRLHSMIAPSSMLEAADEAGLLIINQSGIWSSAGAFYRRGKDAFLDNVRQEFREWVWRDINHPSVVIWDVENEMLRGGDVNDWALSLDGFVRDIDKTRPTIHSGAGAMKGLASVYHVHHNEHYNELIRKWLESPDKPLVLGEFWVGGRAGTPRNITGFDVKTYEEYAALKAETYRDKIVEMRVMGVEGVMPYNFLIYAFRPLFHYRDRLALDDRGVMEPCPDFAAPYGEHMGISRELVNPGWNLRLPPYRLDPDLAGAFRNAFAQVAAFIRERDASIAGGEQVHKTIVTLNDSPEPQQLTIAWEWSVDSAVLNRGQIDCTIGNCETHEQELTLDVPEYPADRRSELRVHVCRDGKIVHQDSLTMTVVAGRSMECETFEQINLFDPSGRSAEMLRSLGVSCRLVTADDVKEGRIGSRALIIGAHQGGYELSVLGRELERFVRQGGRIWAMEQSASAGWLPVPLPVSSGEVQTPYDFIGIGEQASTTRGLYYTKYAAVYAPDHPIFEGVPPIIGPWRHGDGRIADDVFVKPIASEERRIYNCKVLAGGTRQDHATAIETTLDNGSYLQTQFHFTDNAEADPMCRRLLCNILRYLTADRPSIAEGRTGVIGDDTANRLQVNGGVELPAYRADHLDRYDQLLIGSEQPWTTELEAMLEPWLRRGGNAILLERPPGELQLYGNCLRIDSDASLPNSMFVRPGHWATSGLSGIDTELDIKTPPVRYAAILEEGSTDAIAVKGSPIVPLVELVRKSRNSWWYHTPVSSFGYGALQIRVGEGSVVLWQLDTLGDHVWGAHVLRTLLTNMRVPLKLDAEREETVHALYAEDVTVDGHLEEWICDLEDGNVTRWKHAQPIVIPAHSVSRGKANGNVDISGVVYVMHDRRYLYVGAHVIDDIVCPQDPEAELRDGIVIQMDDEILSLQLLPDGTLSVTHGSDGGDQPIQGCETAWRRVTPKEIRANRDTIPIRSGISNPYFSAYALECAIPWSEIGLIDRSRERHNLAVRLIDEDGSGKPETRLSYPSMPLERAWLTFQSD